ncbi:hypothetical protein GSI_14427 [Ganoderma sinense ZZ0214-1]|uniref:Uncharacterized protein n=1 Tax=Ganoderma sinense ZZ0214-1 TaxID=1077348 RepID=A0A2G8RP58_9APHY|nr:hypothetical protein GSI_14427 [Ganoderma sinense ZZ0214-1]
MPSSLDIDALDPNFAPPTRPPSALSTASDTSYFALYEEPAAEQPVDEKNPPAEYLPRRIVVETIRRHGWACLLCGRKDDLAVVRAVLQHGRPQHQHQHENENGIGDGDGGQDPIAWLKSLGLLAPTYERDDWTNLMTLCGPHARAYEDGVWRWVPGAKLRGEMASAVPLRNGTASENSEDEDGDVTMSDITVEELNKGYVESLSKTIPESEEGLGVPAETLVDDGISGNTKNPEIHFKPMELPHFDIVVFRPEAMSPVQNMPANPSTTVWRDWRKLTLNPYIAYASSLSIIGSDSSWDVGTL